MIDESKATAIGKWTASKTVKPYYGKEYRFGTTDDCKMIYQFKNLKTGTYDVQVSYTSGKNRNKQASYDIQHRSGITTKIVDQSQNLTLVTSFIRWDNFHLNKEKREPLRYTAN